MKLLVALVLTGCAPTLRYAANATEVLAEASLVCDAGSTMAGAGHSVYFAEQNPVLGRSPSDGRTVVYFEAIGGALAGLNEVFTLGTDKSAGNVWRIAMNLVILGLEVHAVRGNTSAGVPICGV